jgi:cell division protein FtsQ
MGVFAVGAVTCLFVYAHQSLMNCGYFRAKTVNIFGIERLSRGEILKWGQITPNMNILSVNLSLTRRRLMAHPWIAWAEVKREIPSGITLKIREHKALGIIDFQRRYLVNVNGEIFKQWDRADPRGLPVIYGLDYSDFNDVGQMESRPFEAAVRVLQLDRRLGALFPDARLEKIEVDRDIGITLYPKDTGITVRFGYSDFRLKSKRLKIVLHYLKTSSQFTDVISIDLSQLDRIVVLPIRVGLPDKGDKEV